MVGLTTIGTKAAVWVGLSIAIALLGGSLRASILSILAMLMAQGLINLVLKPSIHRRRPYTKVTAKLLVGQPGPHSWPSAHAGSSMAAAVSLSYFYPAWTVLFLLLALGIAYSRVYVGVHYPVDVLAGMLVGITSAIVVVIVSGLL